ncbi:uncharacterized protein KIAA0513-like [Protopterus annectens]|uniref:uncharacterized protein KIAA0513-like n=1 Tax=Protopterus annectens TaxID=7888 RepID=UPI001CF937E9|nr:uncharacterized protein KIAA0513-like [Protopterus annectens]
MAVPEVPVGNLIDFDSDVPAAVSASPLQKDLDSSQSLQHNEPEDSIESDATESADSENDMNDSPNHFGWNNSRRSSSNDSFSSNLSAESMEDEETAERREFMRKYVEKIFSATEDVDQEEKARFGELCTGENGKGREWFARYVSAQVM